MLWIMFGIWLCTVGVCIYLICTCPEPDKTITDLRFENKIPTFREIQELVGAKVDGVIGKETLRLWDEKLCDQHAAEAFKEMK